MLKWLTRNDGSRMARAKRRLKSPRGSVFSEFALVVPVVALVCSALIEIVGFWDAQIMANHTAWTVGRMVVVRGSDGLAFSSSLDKKSKTGIKNTDMPESIKKLIDSINAGISGVNKFNNRGNIATLFLMSTCGIGYYGSSPGKALSDGFTSLCQAAVDAFTKGIPDWIKEAVSGIKLPSFIPGGESGIGGFVNKIVGAIVDKIAEYALKPIAEGIQKLLLSAFEKILGKDGIKLDELFSGESTAARHARQIYGAASRIVRAKSTIGKEVLTIEDMDNLRDGFIFSKLALRGRLAYPQVVDTEAKSDGYFVTGAHGWPANYGGLAMVHVEVNWPYESGWLFPVVSGRGSAAGAKPIVATGHSMVFPQPDISNENLYSEGAKAYDPGSYTNKTSLGDLDDLAKEMKDYLKYVKFCMRFRICDESLSFKDGKYHVASATWWKYIPELKDLWPFNSGDGDSYPVRGDYGKCWSALTDDRDQDTKESTLNDKGYFNGSSYHNRDYFHWDGSYHKSYHKSICDASGNAGLTKWYDNNRPLNYQAGSGDSAFPSGSMNVSMFRAYYSICMMRLNISARDRSYLMSMMGSQDTLYGKICEFAKRNKVNVSNIVKWQEGLDFEAWKADDVDVHTLAKGAEGSFQVIRKLVRDEIKDIENMENGTSSWTGNEDDPVFDPNDEEVMKNPDAAAKKAREKWKTMKANLKSKLLEVDKAAKDLRDEWERYKTAVSSFELERANCVQQYFCEACIRLFAANRTMTVFDKSADDFKIPAGYIPYDIGKGTRDMLARVKEYQAKLNAAYNKEVEYGAMLGLESAGSAKRDGKTPDQIINEADGVLPDSPGSLAPGSDAGSIIDKDKQEYSGGAWKWM